MISAYQKLLGKFTKVLGIGKTPPPPCWGKFPDNSVILIITVLFILPTLMIKTAIYNVGEPEYLGAK